jgi:hypothetical protein
MANENLSIKDTIILFENSARTEADLKKTLEAATKEDLVAHILSEATNTSETDSEDNGPELDY